MGVGVCKIGTSLGIKTFLKTNIKTRQKGRQELDGLADNRKKNELDVKLLVLVLIYKIYPQKNKPKPIHRNDDKIN